MTTLACTTAAPTRFERLLRNAAARLSRIADERMLRRTAIAERTAAAPLIAGARRRAIRSRAFDAQRDAAATMRCGMLPR